MSTKLVRGERRCAVGVEHDGSTMFAQYVRADWADDQIKQLVAALERIASDDPMPPYSRRDIARAAIKEQP